VVHCNVVQQLMRRRPVDGVDGLALPRRDREGVEQPLGVPSCSLAPVVEPVQALRGVAFIVADIVLAEVGDFHRLDNPRQLMAYLGLTPAEHSSGNAVRRGGSTKAGSELARRAVIKGASSYRIQACFSRKLHARIEGLPKAASDIASKGQLQMCTPILIYLAARWNDASVRCRKRGIQRKVDRARYLRTGPGSSRVGLYHRLSRALK